jgi:endonuclease YncB( thermonuclease family)
MAHDFKRFPELTNSQMQFYYWDSPHKQITEGFLAEVVKVTDGDSIRVKTEFRDFDFPIRLAKINAPELNEGGEESKSWLEKELLGEEVYIKVDKNNRVGKFGRIIGEVLLFGVNINYQSLAEGMSIPFGQEISQ